MTDPTNLAGQPAPRRLLMREVAVQGRLHLVELRPGDPDLVSRAVEVEIHGPVHLKAGKDVGLSPTPAQE